MPTQLSIAELEAEAGEFLPAREALALVTIGDINLGNISSVVGVNTAVAFNALSPNANAFAFADQSTWVFQH